jgi:hemin uptake protein HemP
MNNTQSKPFAMSDDAQSPDMSMPPGPGLPCVRAKDLFGIDREIMIEHLGAYYRLRLTRANKLILTK